MKLSYAAALLGVNEGASKESVREAWALAVKAAHPDTGASPVRAAAVIEKLTEARDLLLNALAGADLACKLCGGTGKVRATLGARDCTACNGTGERTP
jgi:DnaJ-class molecular chaperone